MLAIWGEGAAELWSSKRDRTSFQLSKTGLAGQLKGEFRWAAKLEATTEGGESDWINEGSCWLRILKIQTTGMPLGIQEVRSGKGKVRNDHSPEVKKVLELWWGLNSVSVGKSGTTKLRGIELHIAALRTNMGMCVDSSFKLECRAILSSSCEIG